MRRTGSCGLLALQPRLDQGLDSSEVSPTQTLDPDLVEDSYIIQIDNRLGRIATKDGDAVPEDFIDDDNIAYYTVDVGLVAQNTDDTNAQTQTIAGPRGLHIKPLSIDRFATLSPIFR